MLANMSAIPSSASRWPRSNQIRGRGPRKNSRKAKPQSLQRSPPAEKATARQHQIQEVVIKSVIASIITIATMTNAVE